MIFDVKTVEILYEDENEIIRLKKLGFEFEPYDGYYYKRYIIKNSPVKIEINTVEELVDFTKIYGDIILSENLILIYDGDIE